MNIDLTRRTLLHLAGASSLAAAAAAAAHAEGGGNSGGPTFANRTPMRVGTVTIRVRVLDTVADFYRDVIGLAVMERTATSATLGAGGVKLLVLEAHPGAANESRNAAGLYHTAFLMPARKDLARWLVHTAINRVPMSGFPITASANRSISTTPRVTVSRSMPIAIPRSGNGAPAR